MSVLPFCVLLLVTVSCTDSTGIKCFDCQRLPLPRDCDHVTTCGDHEVCHVTQYVSRSGHGYYDIGCIDELRCSLRSDISYNTSDVTSYEDAGDIITCEECCHGDFCNNQGCGSPPLAPITERGPVCFNCPYGAIRPEFCEKLMGCQKNEQCYVEPFTSVGGDSLYRSGCRVCPLSGDVLIGKRDTCHGCCTTDYCNYNCSLLKHVQSVSSTIMTSTTTVKSLADGCPDSSYTFVSKFNLCYKIFNQTITWNEARNQCILDNAVLLEPVTREEVDYFDKILRGAGGVKYWIGARQDSHVASVFRWQTSNQIVASNLWHENEPSTDSEKCASIYWYNREPLDLLFLLNDVRCDYKMRYICQYH
ncbi:Asialoglycoprotein receptor 1 [Mactra antiquata]